MNKEIKSIAYAFASKDLNIYFPDGEDNCFMVEKSICSNCGQYWHTSLCECYFCGALNFYLFTCDACGKKHSITGQGKQCTCGDKNLHYKCQNTNCVSNTNADIRMLVGTKKGVFDRGSSFNLSLTHCVTCGCKANVYKTYRVYVSFDAASERELIAKKLFANDLFICKKSNTDYDVHYLDEKLQNKKLNVKSIGELIDIFYKMKF